ncbi:MAG: hypothetical protein ABIJ56_12960 [Pseudomonadota bacterium]
MTDLTASSITSDPKPVHRFLAFEGDGPPMDIVRKLAVQLANYYAKKELSRKQWKKQDRQRCKWRPKDKQTASSPIPKLIITEEISIPFHPDDFVRDLASSAHFDQSGRNAVRAAFRRRVSDRRSFDCAAGS